MTRRETAAGPTRRGIGVLLYLVALTVAILLAVTVTRIDFSTWALREAGAGAGGAVAEQLALSVVAEALWHFSHDGNDPKKPLFEKIRELLKKDGEGPIDLTSELEPELLLQSLKDPSLGKVLETAKVTEFQVVLRPAEHPNDLLLKATVRISLPWGEVSRTVTEIHPYGVDLIAPVQPLDQVPVAALQSEVLQQHTRTLARWLDAICWVNRGIRRFKGLCEKLKKMGPGGAGPVPVSIMPVLCPVGAAPALVTAEKQLVQQIEDEEPWRAKERALGGCGRSAGEMAWSQRELVDLAGLTPLVFLADGSVQPPPEIPEVVLQGLLLETQPASSVLMSLDKETNLSLWDPNRRFATALAASLEAVEKLAVELNDQQVKLLVQQDSRKKLDEQDLKRYLNDTAGSLTRISRVFVDGSAALNAYARKNLASSRAPFHECFQKATGVHPVVGMTVKAGDELDAWFKARSGTNGYVTIDSRELKPQHAQQPGGSAAGADGRQPCGRSDEIKTYTLKLEGWKGKAVLEDNAALVPADAGITIVSVEKLTLADKAKDRLVVRLPTAVLGEGTIEASLQCVLARFRGEPRIHGSLIIENHTLGEGLGGRAGTCRLGGTVTFDGRHVSGIYQDPRLDKAEFDRVCDENAVLMVSPRSWDRKLAKGSRSR